MPPPGKYAAADELAAVVVAEVEREVARVVLDLRRTG
jgi:hypothetical protein